MHFFFVGHKNRVIGRDKQDNEPEMSLVVIKTQCSNLARISL